MPDKKHAETERARRLQELIDKGPRPASSPHEFIQERMREERKKQEDRKPDGPKSEGSKPTRSDRSGKTDR